MQGFQVNWDRLGLTLGTEQILAFLGGQKEIPELHEILCHILD